MSVSYPILGDIWPYEEASAAPELAALPIRVFFGDQGGSSVSAAEWITPVDPSAAPRAAYALRLRRGRRQGDIARWDPAQGEWIVTRNFPLLEGEDTCAIVQLHGVLLGGVDSPEALSTRMRALMAPEMSRAKVYRLLSKVLSILSIVTLFYAVRSGVESYAAEPFALIFCLAFGIGLLAVGLRTRTRALNEEGLQRMREQFQFEYRKADHGALSLNSVSAILQDINRKREEEAVIFGFLLLLCFVYFISPLVVIGVIVALIVVTMITGDPQVLRVLGIAFDRSETRLEHAALSFRASHDALAPPALRMAKKEVMRDRLRRYGDMLGRVRQGQAKARLNGDLAIAVAFVIIFSAYAFPIAAGIRTLAASAADSLVTTSLFRVAPVIILLSISKSTVALAQVLNRRLALLGK
ncbi:hypothetical protein [Arenibacterium halophilum]|uniref:ABC transmembrane type-1 domain-containing protein n=1 Tax=Arenibacterium halophilum TaxID=2583821 RepID=A0ABY2XB83_9RHOB|nr:hypothetical protein [Arenibacterium halophilum]TMV13620.1 hypothetical protein FGK64_12870 [Arenibacterium halophilum]